MNNAGTIKSIFPEYAIPGGEIAIECEGFHVDPEGSHGVIVDEGPCDIVAASSRRVLAIVPEYSEGSSPVALESFGEMSEPADLTIGIRLVDDMHIVANPAIDPKNDTIVVTRSGSRGQKIDGVLYGLEADEFIDRMPVEMMNPTGIAFDPVGDMYVTNRFDGEVVRIERGEEAVPYASGLGIATGIAFDADGRMYVGDRGGMIYRVDPSGNHERFAGLEPSVAAYHLAFGPDGRLYVTAPGLASSDAVYAIDTDGGVTTYFRGFGRPQGLAFDREGNLYVAASYRGSRGIVRIDQSGIDAELLVAGANVIGLCFSRQGEMIVATNTTVYSLEMNIYGTLLD